MQKYVRVSKTKVRDDVPMEPSTLYKWHHMKRHPEIFRKVGGFLFVDLKALETLIEQGMPK